MNAPIDRRLVDLASFQEALVSELQSSSEMQVSELYVPILSHDDRWLLNSSLVARIVIPEKITAVPGASQHVVGIINVGGIIYTLVDFNVLLGRSPVQRNSRSRAVCLESHEAIAGVALYVDRIFDFATANGFVKGKPNTHALSRETWEYEGGAFHVMRNDLITMIPKSTE